MRPRRLLRISRKGFCRILEAVASECGIKAPADAGKLAALRHYPSKMKPHGLREQAHSCFQVAEVRDLTHISPKSFSPAPAILKRCIERTPPYWGRISTTKIYPRQRDSLWNWCSAQVRPILERWQRQRHKFYPPNRVNGPA